MISELKDDEILEFLMTSDFEGDYSPTELKYLLTKWRYFYRILNGRSDRDVQKLEGDLQTIENQIKTKDLQIGNLKNEIINKDDTITTMKNRNLTFKERWSGKIILNKNEN
jgi:hypothetical protein